MKRLSYLMCLVAGLLLSCQDALQLLENPSSTGMNALSISVTTDHTATKGLIEDDYLEDRSTIGVSVTSSTGGDYDGNSYNNLLYTATGTGAEQTWSGSAITLSMNEGTCYAYYPYNAEVSDITAVPVSTSGQVDYMVATPVTVSALNKSAELGMKHALSAVRFMIKNGSYAGTGKVTAVSVSSAGLGTSGSLNVKTGEVTAVTGTGTAIGVDTDITLSNVEQNVDVIVAPTGTAADLTLSITLDAKVYSTVISSATIQQTKCQKYTLTVNQGELALSGVKVGDWGYDESGAPTITAGGYTVTFAGDYSDIAFSNSKIGNSLIIEAYAKNNNYQPNAVTILGSASLSQTTTDRLREIKISDIASDIIINFAGASNQIWKSLSDGVYAVKEDGTPVAYASISSEPYNAVAFVIKGKAYQVAKTDATGFGGSEYVYWWEDPQDVPDLPEILTADGNNHGGYFGGSEEPQLNANPSEWAEGALGDFNGLANSTYIIAAQGDGTLDNTLGKAIVDFRNNPSVNEGKSDWFAPSCGELAYMYLNLAKINNLLTNRVSGTALSNSRYWTSSHANIGYAWYMDFSTYVVSIDWKFNSKTLRLIRAL